MYSEGHVKIIDLGIADFQLDPDDGGLEEEQDQKQKVQGTYRYLAPELLEAENKPSFSSIAQDVWALGCLIIEMVTGKKPFAFLDTDKEVIDYLAVGFSPWDLHE